MTLRKKYNQGKLKWIMKQFVADLPDDYQITAIDTGHINDTFRINSGMGNNFLLQRKNHLVFKNVPGMMDNIDRVTRHLSDKQNSGEFIIGRRTTIPLRTIKDHQPYVFVDNEFWTLTTYIPGVSYEKITGSDQAYRSGRAFGAFVSVLADLPGPDLHKTIADFHNMKFRYAQFLDAKSQDVMDRAKEVQKEIDFFEQQITYVMPLHEAIRNGNIPERVIHNDTKINNLLFDEQNQVFAIIDLDTVMPGAIHYDYGDAIRTSCNTKGESERNHELIRFNKEVFKAFTEGYVQETKTTLTVREKEFLPLAPFYMTYIMGIRFLTDYLNGDVYYSISDPDDNMVRARSQIRYYWEMKKEKTFINELIGSY